MPYINSGGKQCCVFGCTNNQKKITEWRSRPCNIHGGLLLGECECPRPYQLHRFPRNEERRRQWAVAIRRENFTPSDHSVVCSHHFVDKRPTNTNPNPTRFLGYDKTENKPRRTLQRVIVYPACQPKITDVPVLSDIEDDQLPAEGIPMDVPFISDDESYFTPQLTHPMTTDCCTCHACHCSCHSQAKRDVQLVSSSTQTDTPPLYIDSHGDHTYSRSPAPRMTPPCPPPPQSVGIQVQMSSSVSEQMRSDSDCIFYTGIPLAIFWAIVMSCQKVNVSFRMNLGDQLLLVLTRLRLGLTFTDLGRRFGISKTLASVMFAAWIKILAKRFKDCVVWLPRASIQANLPKSFQDNYPNTTVVIDCTEIYCQRPFNLKARAQTWSTYKSHNTVKLLIGVAPHGFIMFISKCYGGRISDKCITQRSGFLDYLSPGDEVMADRGFLIQEDLFARRVALNMPSFLRGRKQLSEKETTESRRIASVRIHVERTIARLKSWKILQTVQTVKSLKLMDYVVRVCCILCNLRGDLIKSDPEI